MPKAAVYKKRPAPKAPIMMDKGPSPPRDRSFKKRPAPQPNKQWEPRTGSDYGFECNITPSKVNPIKEMQLIGRRNTEEVYDRVCVIIKY